MNSVFHEYFVMNWQRDIVKEYRRKKALTDNEMIKILTRLLEGCSDRTLYMLKREMAVSKQV